MQVRILKGTNQIGGAISEITSSKGTKIIIDFGCDLDDNKRIFEVDGLTSNTPKYDAVFITHSHGDHSGLAHRILEDIPIYIEEKNAYIFDVICDFTKDYASKLRPYKNSNVHFFTFETPIMVNDIKVTPYIVDHSCYNSAMFLIEADGKRILHTGDFRNTGKKGVLFKQKLKEIGHVDLLITEGTSLSRNQNNKTEKALSRELKNIMHKYDQVYVMSSSTNIDRIVSFYNAREDKIFIEDLCMASIASKLPKIPNSNTFKKVYTYISKCYRNKKEPYGRYQKFLKNVIEDIPFEQKFIMFVKPSMIKDLEEHKDKIKNACVIYSMWEGYINDLRKDDYTLNALNKLETFGAKIYKKHTSGHAEAKAISILRDIVIPDKVIIIHTESKDKAMEIGKVLFKDKLLDVTDKEIVKI